ncbi:MAG: serine/threonine protein kinase, partial [Calditrichaeota bacterium]
MEPLKQIGDIQVFAEIHRGATTMVYKGYQPALERFVLLKVLRLEFAGDESVSARFEEEAKITARIHHPNVVPIYEFGRVGDWSYFAAEFVDGLDLRHLIARQSLPPLLACFVIQEVAKGLKAAHDINILHKDIKPSNVLISNRGEVKLTDFGMADIRESAQEQIEGTASGTLPYFSPEQILGEPVGKPSDIFALGATFYEMLTGEQAFQGQQESEFLDAIVNFDPVPFLEGQKNIAPELVAICRKMLKKKAAERYRDCGALLADLNAFGENTGLRLGSKHLARYLEDPASAVTIGTLPEEEPHPHRRRVAAYVASLLLAAGVIFAGYLSLKGDRTPSSNVNDLASARIADSLTAKVDSSSTAVSREEEEPDLTPPEPVVQRVAAVPPPKAETLAQDTLVSSPRETAVAQEEADRPPSPGFLQVSCAPWAVVF